MMKLSQNEVANKIYQKRSDGREGNTVQITSSEPEFSQVNWTASQRQQHLRVRPRSKIF